MGAQWIFHKGKRILYIDYNGLGKEEQLDLIREATQILLGSGSKDNLTLSDCRNMAVTTDFVELAKEQGKLSGAVTHKAAVLGVVGVRKVLLQAINRFSGNPRVPFDTPEQAKEWLVQ